MKTKTLHFYTKMFYWLVLACIPVVFSALFLLYQIRGFPILKLDDNVQSTFILITNIFIGNYPLTTGSIYDKIVLHIKEQGNGKIYY
ncbi:hypothetical protein ASJ33_01545 [Dehalococcoides mccartyi]|jgi:hypothetical protein|nr:hypothetical protein X792_01275 [Dehalococcoides mccartyi CG1]APH11927.1 hypothetical protein ASJ33_01545 [Dehalococcoides mccartyi]